MIRIDHKWACTFNGGAIVFEEPEKVKIDCLELDGKRGYCVIRPMRKEKSSKQHRYYFGVVVKRFAEYWGASKKDAHSALSAEHLKTIPSNPEMPSYIRSTDLMAGGWSTDEWEEYMEYLRRWGLEEFGLYIELPNEVDLTTIMTAF